MSGLEWPVIFMYEMDDNPNENFTGLRIVTKSENIDIQDPLKGRLICYWPNPYSNQSGGTALMTAMENSTAAQEMRRLNLEEEARLLYVGLTRARDYLVFPSFAGIRMHWLDRVYQKDKYNSKGKETESLPLDCPVLPWSWKGEAIPVAYKHYIVNLPKTEENRANEVAQVLYHLPTYKGEQEYESLQLQNLQNLIPIVESNVLEAHSFYHAFPYASLNDFPLTYAETSQLFAKFILADSIDFVSKTNQDYRLNCAENLLQQYYVMEHIGAEKLLRISEAFYEQFKTELPFQEKHYLRNFRLFNKAQYFTDTIDFHAITKTGNHIFVISVEDNILPNDYANIAKNYAEKYYAAAQALGAKDLEKCRFILLFPLQAKCLDLQLTVKQMQPLASL